MKKGGATRLVDNVARVVFAVAACVLVVLAAALMFDAVVQLVRAVWSGGGVGVAALSGAGSVVVAIAVFEIAKFLIEEEILRGREMRVASEARRSLTHFVSTIAIAVFLEALVILFQVSRENVPYLIYPTMLFVAGILLVLGLAIYQRLSASVEARVEEKDKAEIKREIK